MIYIKAHSSNVAKREVLHYMLQLYKKLDEKFVSVIKELKSDL